MYPLKNNQAQQYAKIMISITSRMHVCDVSRPAMYSKFSFEMI